MRFALALLMAVVLVCPAVAQLDRGALTGTVTDSSGAAVPSAKVTVRNTGTNAGYETETTMSGQYTLPNLPYGSYEVIVEASGFKKFVRTNLALRAAEVLRVDAKLDIGQLAETVEVSAQVSRVQTDSPQVGTSLTNSNIIDLPLSFSGARSPEGFAYRLTPGVAGSSWTSHINGSTTASKDVLVDGASSSTFRAGHFGESTMSLEAVQEFKVQTSGMSAEFGRMQAGVFNFVLKSGANQVHGSAYGALRNEALNANSWVNNFRGVKRSQDRKQNFAGSAGGPVYLPKVYNGKDKSFFYVAYERYRERTGGFGAPNRTLPQPEFYDGNFARLLQTVTAGSDALGRSVMRGAIYDPATFRQVSGGTRYIGDMYPGNVIPKSRFSEVSQRVNEIAKKYYLPTIRDATGQIALVNNGIFPVANTPQFDQHQFSVKGDQILGSRHKISGSYTFTLRPRLLLDQGGMWSPEGPEGGPLSKARRQRTKSQLGRLSYDWTITPTLLTNANTSWNRFYNPNSGVHAGLDGAKELGIKNWTTYGFPAISWGGGPYVGLDNPGDPQKDVSVYSSGGIMATFSLSRGRHFLKWGADERTAQLNTRPTAGGSISFNARGTAIPGETYSGSQTGYAFASYLLGIVDSAGRGVPISLGGRRRYLGLFFQDDFKVSQTLTVNLGMRWDYQPPYYEVADRMGSWNLTKTDPLTGFAGAYDFAGSCDVCTKRRFFGQKNYRGWGPRFGLAWQARPGWTVRTAYGIFYEADLFNQYGAIPGATAFPWQGSYNLSADSVLPWKGIFNWDAGFPTDRFIPAAMDVSFANRAGGAPLIVDPGYGRPSYTQQWNLNLQRQLARTLLLDIGYVGNKTTGIKNNALARVNQLPASVLTQYGRNLPNAVTTPEQAAANGVRYPFAGYRGTVAGALRQFPQLSGTTTFGPYGAPLGFANYHSLQVILDKQFGKGLSGYANYVYSKVLSNTESSFVGDNAGPLDYYNLRLEKAPATFDLPHMFKAYLQYEVPFGKGRAFSTSWRVVDAVLGG
ncbi:MAG: TonB-dependent receptor, partial [Acidobacteria bacterium]|nr:TonB-dependent receptor [Acidobacteriota bacterium]